MTVSEKVTASGVVAVSYRVENKAFKSLRRITKRPDGSPKSDFTVIIDVYGTLVLSAGDSFATHFSGPYDVGVTFNKSQVASTITIFSQETRTLVAGYKLFENGYVPFSFDELETSREIADKMSDFSEAPVALDEE